MSTTNEALPELPNEVLHAADSLAKYAIAQLSLFEDRNIAIRRQNHWEYKVENLILDLQELTPRGLKYLGEFLMTWKGFPSTHAGVEIPPWWPISIDRRLYVALYWITWRNPFNDEPRRFGN